MVDSSTHPRYASAVSDEAISARWSIHTRYNLYTSARKALVAMGGYFHNFGALKQ